MRKTPVVLGVLSMVFGGLIAIYSLFGVISQLYFKSWAQTLGTMMKALPHQEGAPEVSKMMAQSAVAMESLKYYTLGISGGLMLLSIVLAVIGFGLYRRQGWARSASLMWSLMALVFLVVQCYVQAAIVMPRTTEIMMSSMPNMKGMGLVESMMGAQKTLAVVGQLIFYAPFPIILLILMGRSSAKNDLLG